LDGTLYPDFRFFRKLIPFLIKEHRLLRAFGKARTKLRKADLDSHGSPGRIPVADFYQVQARIMGEILNVPPDVVRESTERLIYRGWEPLFRKVRLFPHVREILDIFKSSGIVLGLLSDFPVEAKLKNLELDAYWDAVVCSELTGHLKPDAAPFLELSARMKTIPEKILYVGNNYSYDVEGASRAGMKTALIQSRWIKHSFYPQMRAPAAPGAGIRADKKITPDFIFFDYRQLRDFVLG